MRALMTHILVTLKHALAHKAFGTWLAYEHEERRLENVGKRVLVMLTRGCLLRCFHALQAERDERRRLRELVTSELCARCARASSVWVGGAGARLWSKVDSWATSARGAWRSCAFVGLCAIRLVVSFSTWRRGSRCSSRTPTRTTKR